MSDIIEKARATRVVIEKAIQAGLSDEDALEYPNLFPSWDPMGKLYLAPDDERGPQSKVKFEGNGLLYKCITSHTSQVTWPPDQSPSLWIRMDNPAEEWPEWVQPTGATDSYGENAKVSHNGKHWINTFGDGNVWEPGVYGWEEVTD